MLETFLLVQSGVRVNPSKVFNIVITVNKRQICYFIPHWVVVFFSGVVSNHGLTSFAKRGQLHFYENVVALSQRWLDISVQVA